MFKRLLAALLTLLLFLPAALAQQAESPASIEGEAFMKELKIGWNLGNTFDAPDGETSWGAPVTTPELIQTVKELGFNTLRIPISWHRHVSAAPEYRIQENWMNRVETVVNEALDAGLYVIINSHHDNSVYSPALENAEAAEAYLSAIWDQIARRFQDAPQQLIFQTMNEPRVEGTSYEWNVETQNPDCMAAVEVVNRLNQAALDAIRATGGNNADRYVIVCPYAGSPNAALLDAYRLPTDSAEGRLIQSVHAYTPYRLCLDMNAPDTLFATIHRVEIRIQIEKVHQKFSSLGIPVIIDEMGCINKDNPEQRYAWAKAYIACAQEYGVPCCWWDNHCIVGNGERFGLIDRRNLCIYPESQRVYDGLMEGLVP